MRAKYLIRIDDICPTMNWRVWTQVEQIMREADLQPIVAVVPDNQDPNLMVDQADPAFWERVREWKSLGWTIAMHGYQHCYVTRESGLVGLNPYSEFAGLPFDEQMRKIRCGLEIFEREKLTPDLWVAPAHSFDLNTVEVLSQHSIRCISDGFAIYPHLDRRSVLWVPQQLWRFRWMPMGLWTVCIHHNHWSQADVARFRNDVARYRAAITSLPEVLGPYRARRRNRIDGMVGFCFRFWHSLAKRLAGKPSQTPANQPALNICPQPYSSALKSGD